MFFTSIKNKIKSFETALINLEASFALNVKVLESRIVILESVIKTQAEADAKKVADYEAAIVAKSAPYIDSLKAKLADIKAEFVVGVSHSEIAGGTPAADVALLAGLIAKAL